MKITTKLNNSHNISFQSNPLLDDQDKSPSAFETSRRSRDLDAEMDNIELENQEFLDKLSRQSVYRRASDANDIS